jgi:hypothetical protein
VDAAFPFIHAVERDQIVAAQLMAVSRHQVHFVGQVSVAHIAVGRVPAAHEIDLQYIAAQSGGLALDAVQPPSDAEDQIATGVLRERLEHLDA